MIEIKKLTISRAQEMIDISYDFLTKLNIEAGGVAPLKEQFLKWFTSNFNAYGIVDNEILQGFIAYTVEIDRYEPYFWFIKEEFRGKGYDNDMLSLVEKNADEENKPVLVFIHKVMKSEIDYATRRGYIIVSEKPDGFWMKKTTGG